VTLNNPPEIRPLAPSEIDAVCRVLGLARLHQRNGSYLVAWDAGEPIGHAYLAMTDPPEIQDVEVRSAFQRRGTVHRLITAVEATAVANGAGRLRLSVSAHNQGAQALYRSLGFEDTGVAPRVVRGTIEIRTGPLEVDDTMLTWEKRVGGTQ
jgi:ribosomal protein S18 acetylase RimI-like enzyme